MRALRSCLLHGSLVGIASMSVAFAQDTNRRLDVEWQFEIKHLAQSYVVPVGAFDTSARTLSFLAGDVVRLISGDGRLIRDSLAVPGASSVGWRGDSVFFISPAQGREYLLRPGQQSLSSRPIPIVSLPSPYLAARVVRSLSNGDFLALGGVSYQAALLGAQARIPLLVASIDGSVRRILAVTGPGSDVAALALPSGGTMMRSFGGALAAIANTRLVTVVPTADEILIVDRSDRAGAVRVTRMNAQGDTLADFGLNLQPRRSINAAQLRRILEPHARELSDEYRGTAAAADALIAALGSPTDYSPVSAIRAGSDGSIWLQLGAVPASEGAWLILRRTGSVIGTVRLPPSARPVAVSSSRLVYWLPRDSGTGHLVSARIR